MVRLMSYVKYYIHRYHFIEMPDQFDSSFHPYILQKRTPKLSPRYFKLFNSKSVRVVAPPMSFNIELWRPRQPLIFPPIHAPNGGLRSVKHEHRNVVIRVRGYVATNFRDNFRRCKHNKACSSVIYRWYKKYWG